MSTCNVSLQRNIEKAKTLECIYTEIIFQTCRQIYWSWMAKKKKKKKKKKIQTQELINIESKCLPLFSIFSLLFSSAVGHLGLPWWLSGKKSACNVVDPDLIPESGRSPGEGNSNPFWNSCLGNSMNRAWQATVHAVAKSQIQLRD